MTDRLLRVPLGKVTAHSIGEIKGVMMDKIEDIEPPLAHIIPEGSGHLVPSRFGPVDKIAKHLSFMVK